MMVPSGLCFIIQAKIKPWLRDALLICIVLLVATSASAADRGAISVLFPDIKEPYRGIFKQIIEGVEGKIGKQVDSYPVRADTNIEKLQASLQQGNTKALIALGRQGLATATVLGGDFRIVVGGVLTVPESKLQQEAVISLTPDPELLFARMKSLQPLVKRIFVVFNPANNGWLIKYAQDVAHVQGVQLVAYEAHNLRTAITFYQKIFAEADGRHDAIWLPQDHSTVEEGTVLPLVLQEAWDKSIAVFSSNSSHVRRGVLFSLYPDNVALGISLAELAQDSLSLEKHKRRGAMPLREVQSVINLRTGKHLRIKSYRMRDFDAILNE